MTIDSMNALTAVATVLPKHGSDTLTRSSLNVTPYHIALEQLTMGGEN